MSAITPRLMHNLTPNLVHTENTLSSKSGSDKYQLRSVTVTSFVSNRSRDKSLNYIKFGRKSAI